MPKSKMNMELIRFLAFVKVKNGWDDKTYAQKMNQLINHESWFKDKSIAVKDVFDVTYPLKKKQIKSGASGKRKLPKPSILTSRKINVSKFIKFHRLEKGLSKRQFAKAVGMAPETIANLENQTVAYVHRRTLKKLSIYFQCSAKHILTFNDVPQILTPEKLGVFLRHKRKILNLNQTEMANRIGLNQRMISMYELGHVLPKKETFDKICDYFKCDIRDIINFNPDEKLLPTMSDFCIYVVFQKHSNKWSRRQMKSKTGLNEKTLKGFEEFKCTKISTKILNRLCMAFNTTPFDIAKRGQDARACDCPVLKLVP